MITLEDIKNKEQRFRVNEKHGDTTLPSHSFSNGDEKVILTAPHTVITADSKNALKKEEVYTGAITLTCGDIVGCHTMVRNNYNEITAATNYFNHYLIDYIKSNKMLCQIDIHGASIDKPFDVAIGTNNLAHIYNDSNIVGIVDDGFFHYGINNIVWNSKFQASTKATLCRQSFVNCGIHTIQLEINRAYRNINEFEKMLAIISSISEIAKNLSDYLDYSKKLELELEANNGKSK